MFSVTQLRLLRMSDFTKAVFLSYASQDVAAALRICAALRAAGVEVWFDQDALVGGDAWDAKIRGQPRAFDFSEIRLPISEEPVSYQ